MVADVLATVLQVLAAVLAGALNAVAGGGSFFTLPALLFSGISPVAANATSTVVLWPGSVASTLAYGAELRLFSARERRLLWVFGAVSLVGGGAGAVLLLYTPARIFESLLPFLLLIATLTFTFGERLRRGIQAEGAHVDHWMRRGLPLQWVIAIYGGYFGGGIGFMMLAAFALLGMTDLNRMNGLKSAFAVLINGSALFTFILTGNVAWRPAVAMVAGAIAGGYAGASLARSVDQKRVRKFVISVGWLMTGVFFYRTFLR
ncbi:MAG: sulfite exporter TauE/SafE family protein [Myxococcaceae bacterium]